MRSNGPSNFKISRHTLTQDVDGECVKIINEATQRFTRLAEELGATMVSDGRSNINNDPLLVLALRAGDGFLPLGAHNTGSNKKDAEYLVRYSIEYVNLHEKLACHTYALVSDGARVCLNAMDTLADKEYLVAIRCQSHCCLAFVESNCNGSIQDDNGEGWRRYLLDPWSASHP